MGTEFEEHVDNMAAYSLEVIILASTILHCTAMQSFLRFCQNGITIGAGGGSHSCPMCGASMAARLSHIVRCGVVWVFLAEHCAGLRWDFSAPDRWTLLFGSGAQNAAEAAMLCLAWDAIVAGINAGRLAGVGFDAAVARRVALSKRPGQTGMLATCMGLAPPAVP
jgi:predicted RNA-binding Zn-ribbon protein involved in translation (DUF1610 family)